MEWFKHDSSAANDAKVRKLVIRYGATGYAIYFHCLELIVGDISQTNLTFQLEHDSEIIADNLKITGTSEKSGQAIVEEIMLYMIELGLFTDINGRIFCFQLLKRLDTSMTSNANFRAMITEAKHRHDAVMIPSCKNRTDEIRTDENREDKKPSKELHPVFKVPINRTSYDKLVEEHGQVMVDDYIERVIDYVESSGKKPYLDYAAAARNFIKNDKQKKKGEKDDVDKELEQWRNF